MSKLSWMLLLSVFVCGSAFAGQKNCVAIVADTKFENRQDLPSVSIPDQSGKIVMDIGNHGQVELNYEDVNAEILFVGTGSFLNKDGKVLKTADFHQLYTSESGKELAPRTAGLSFELVNEGIGYVVILCAEGSFE